MLPLSLLSVYLFCPASKVTICPRMPHLRPIPFRKEKNYEFEIANAFVFLHFISQTDLSILT